MEYQGCSLVGIGEEICPGDAHPGTEGEALREVHDLAGAYPDRKVHRQLSRLYSCPEPLSIVARAWFSMPTR